MANFQLPGEDEAVASGLLLLRDARCKAVRPFDCKNSEEIRDVNIAVEFDLFQTRQLSLTSQLRQFVHSSDIAITETDRQQILGCSTRQILFPELD